MRNWFRGFVVDPELEKKAHDFMDRANRTAEQAEKTGWKAERLVSDAERKLRRLNATEVALVTVGTLVSAGIVIGSLMARLRNGDGSDRPK